MTKLVTKQKKRNREARLRLALKSHRCSRRSSLPPNDSMFSLFRGAKPDRMFALKQKLLSTSGSQLLPLTPTPGWVFFLCLELMRYLPPIWSPSTPCLFFCVLNRCLTWNLQFVNTAVYCWHTVHVGGSRQGSSDSVVHTRNPAFEMNLSRFSTLFFYSLPFFLSCTHFCPRKASQRPCGGALRLWHVCTYKVISKGYYNACRVSIQSKSTFHNVPPPYVYQKRDYFIFYSSFSCIHSRAFNPATRCVQPLWSAPCKAILFWMQALLV